MTAPARQAAELLVSTGRPVVAGVTMVVTACCSVELSHVVDEAGDSERSFDLSAFWDADGSQATACLCGRELPDARRWRP